MQPAHKKNPKVIKRRLRSDVNRPEAFKQTVLTQKLGALNQKQ